VFLLLLCTILPVGSNLKIMKFFIAVAVSSSLPLCLSFAPSSPTLVGRTTLVTKANTALDAQKKWNDNDLFEDRTAVTRNNVNTDIFERVGKVAGSALLAVTLSFSAITTPFAGPNGNVISSIPSAQAADGAAIGLCLLKKCQLPLAKCILNPNCLANVICINTCNGKADEEGCQVECGNTFENDVVGEFNKCAVSDMSCVPQKQDDGSYPIPPKDVLVQKFDTKLWNGRWYITAGQNKLFDIFDCQVHFFTETEPGKFFGKLNWRIEEPDGEFFTRDAIQEFYQDPQNPAHLINHDNEYLHYQDDWYIVDYAEDDNKEGVPPFAFVYYRGENDAWIGYGGAVVYTRDAKLPESLLPRLREAAKKVNFDFDKDFALTDNTCKTLEKGEEIVLREKFAGKMAIQTEKQLQQQAVMARTAASNAVGTEVKVAEKAIQKLEDKALEFEKEIAKDVINIEKEVVKDVVGLEKEVVKDVVQIEKAIEAEEKEIVDEIVKEEQSLLDMFKKR
jgi:violaxanthin de-epoxidase